MQKTSREFSEFCLFSTQPNRLNHWVTFHCYFIARSKGLCLKPKYRAFLNRDRTHFIPRIDIQAILYIFLEQDSGIFGHLEKLIVGLGLPSYILETLPCVSPCSLSHGKSSGIYCYPSHPFEHGGTLASLGFFLFLYSGLTFTVIKVKKKKKGN